MKTIFITVLAIALASAAPTPSNGAAALQKRHGPPAPRGNPWEPWHGNPWGPWKDDKVQRVKRPDVGPDGGKVKRSDETTEGNPWAPWHGNPWSLDDGEKREHEPHKEGNPWGPWNDEKGGKR